MGFNALLVALLLAPLATELPEAANSLIWTKDGKDVIALGNVAGAMVFQSTVPVTVGVLLTPWILGPFGTVAAVLRMIPYEVYEVIHHVTLFKVGALLLNLAVVGYLAYRKRLFVGI